MSGGEGGGGFDLFNPLHLLGAIIILFIIWLATGRHQAQTQDKFIKNQDGQQLNTYDKNYKPDQEETDFYKGYFE